VSGSVALQQQVQDAIDEMVASGAEDGLQVAVVYEGRVLVDAVAGVADPRTGQPVTPGTLFFATSTGKGSATSVAHVLVERGKLSY
jgi:CubicO group peptidase (beta-lactamase class C family)